MIDIEGEPWKEMVAHAEATYPNECCGAMLGSTDGDQKTVRLALRLDNAASGSQKAYYVLRPEDLKRAEADAKRGDSPQATADSRKTQMLEIDAQFQPMPRTKPPLPKGPRADLAPVEGKEGPRSSKAGRFS